MCCNCVLGNVIFIWSWIVKSALTPYLFALVVDNFK